MTAVIDPMQVSTGRRRGPKREDHDAAKRREFVNNVFAEAGPGNEEAAIRRLLSVNVGRAKGERITFKAKDFADVGGRPRYCDLRIQYYRDQLAAWERARDGVKRVTPEKAKTRLEKVGRDLLALESFLRAQGVDVSAIRAKLGLVVG